jgi:hypothetical protein
MHPVTLPENKKPDAAQRKPRECKPAGAYHAYQRWEREEKKKRAKGLPWLPRSTAHGCVYFLESERLLDRVGLFKSNYCEKKYYQLLYH